MKNMKISRVRPRCLRLSVAHNFILILFICAFLLLVSGCSKLKYDIIPGTNATYHSMNFGVNINFHPEGKKSRRKQSFKILLKYDDYRDKMLFLSPLNQVYGQLFIENENVLLINSKEKKYWRGRFQTLINKIWALDLNYAEFKELIVAGIIPPIQDHKNNLQISLEKEEGNDIPKRINIDYNDITLKIKIYDRRSGQGLIDFSPRIEKMQKATIKEVLGEDIK